MEGKQILQSMSLLAPAHYKVSIESDSWEQFREMVGAVLDIYLPSFAPDGTFESIIVYYRTTMEPDVNLLDVSRH
jgi:hypothetical protein